MGSLDALCSVAQLSANRRQLKASPLEDASGLEKQYQSLQADVDNYNMMLGALNDRIEKLNKDVGWVMQEELIKLRLLKA